MRVVIPVTLLSKRGEEDPEEAPAVSYPRVPTDAPG